MEISIMNELDAVESALVYFEKLKDDFDECAVTHYKEKVLYRFFNAFFGYTIEKVDYHEDAYYAFKFEYRGFKLYQIESAIENLSTWKTAISRNNHFTITEYAYSKFLYYVSLVEREEV